MYPSEAFKILLPLSVLIGWSAVGFVLYKWPRERSQSISHHMAQNRQAYLLAAFAESISLPLFLWFCFAWFVPTFSLSFVFPLCIVGAVTGLLVGAWVPLTTGIKRKVHDIAAYCGATFFIPCTTVVVLEVSFSAPTRVFAALVLGYMVTCVLLFLYVPKVKQHHLIFQSVYIIAFDVLLLLATYVR